jgi:hypothetical protein
MALTQLFQALLQRAVVEAETAMAHLVEILVLLVVLVVATATARLVQQDRVLLTKAVQVHLDKA